MQIMHVDLSLIEMGGFIDAVIVETRVLTPQLINEYPYYKIQLCENYPF